MKKLLSTLLALCLALTLLPGTALAEEASGSCGENVTWSYSDGTLTIQGTGKMEDYYDPDRDGIFGGRDTPWKAFREQIHTIIIGDGVTRIGNVAFSTCTSLTSVTIPESVTAIGYGAFIASGLTSVTIPDSVTSIEFGAFHSCRNLTSVTIPGSVTTIGGYAFFDCTSLTSVTIREGVTSLEDAVFQFCDGLTSVTIPASITTIGVVAFSCKNLTDVYYGGSESLCKQIKFIAGNDRLLNANIHYNSAAPAPSTPGSVGVTVTGAAVAWTDAEPFIDANDRTMVPLRAVADAMGLEVYWDAAAREAVFTDGGKTIWFPIDSTTARVSEGEPVEMDTAAVIVNERTYAPIRYLAEFFGYTVAWDAAARTVVIT